MLDATTGQNAISQAKLFMQAIPVTGIVLTKLDGTARGGIVITIADELKLPIKLVGGREARRSAGFRRRNEFVDEPLRLSRRQVPCTNVSQYPVTCFERSSAASMRLRAAAAAMPCWCRQATSLLIDAGMGVREPGGDAREARRCRRQAGRDPAYS